MALNNIRFLDSARWPRWLSGITDQMVLIAFVLALLYWAFDALLLFQARPGNQFLDALFSANLNEIWQRLLVLSLFLFFGSHAQYTVEERKRAERALRRSEEKYRALFDAMAPGALELDAEGRLRSANPSARRLLNLPANAAEEIRPIWDWWPARGPDGETLPASAHPAFQTLRTGQAVRAQAMPFSPPGAETPVWLSVNAAPRLSSRERKAAGVFVTFEDVSEIKRAESALRNQNAYMAALHETSLDLIHRLDLVGLLQALVNRATRLADAPCGFLYLYNPAEGVLEMKAGTGIFARVLGLRMKPGEGLAGRVFREQRPIRLPDYRNWPHRSTNSAFADIRSAAAFPLISGDQVEGVIGLAHDRPGRRLEPVDVARLEPFARLASIALDNARLHTRVRHELAERKRAEGESRDMERQLRRAQKMEAMGTLAGGIAHDFNNILGAILGYTELALHEIPADSPAGGKMSQVMRAGHRARDLVRQILLFSRENVEDRELIRIGPVVKEAVKLLRASLPATIAVEQRVDRGLGPVRGNPTEIHQIVMNLCTNAGHAMEETGGVLHISLTEANLGPEGAPPPPPGRHLRLSVRDTGPGMEPETLERIFDPYFTTKNPTKGTGLGLSIVHRIVETMGGTIQARSAPGAGAEFTVFFPEAEAEGPSAPPVVPLSPGGGHRILFVDDEPALAELGREMLERMGYRAEACHGGEETLRRFSEAPNRYDLVLTDMTMPGMTGDRLTRELRRIRPNLPVVICTGFSERINETRARDAGAFALLMKPVTMEDLSRTLHNALEPV
ncbi:MAG: ATP-binding protein [Desulfococcaceae bacterium]